MTAFAARRQTDRETAPGSEDAPIVSFVDEVAHATAADGICVVWRHAADDEQPLFLTTPNADATFEDMLRAVVLTERASANDHAWHATEAGDIMRCDIAASDGVVTVAALFGCAGRRGGMLARRTVERWVPMVRAFFSLWIDRFRAMARERALAAAVNYSDAAIILVDGAGRLTFANHSANTMLDRRDGVRRKGAALSGNRLADTLRLQAAIEHVVQDEVPDGTLAPVVALSRANGRDLLATVVAADRSAYSEHDGAAILYLVDPDQDIHSLAEPACKLYGLSPVETKLTCLLADGHSLTDAAGRMRIREQTARSYLKQIFSKTDTNRQAELVRLMLKSLARTASRRVARVP